MNVFFLGRYWSLECQEKAKPPRQKGSEFRFMFKVQKDGWRVKRKLDGQDT
jgi:hypothetical protein